MSEPRKTFSSHQLGDLAVLLALTAMTIAYLVHVLYVSTHILNTILIVPASALVTGLCCIEFVSQLRGSPRPVPTQDSVRSVLPVMALFVGYVATLPWLGFDVGSFLFIATFLICHGEKRWYWALAYSAVFALSIAAAFSVILPYPMPMLILPTEY